MNSVLYHNGLPSPAAMRAAMERAGAIYPDRVEEAWKVAQTYHKKHAEYQANYRKLKRQKKLNQTKP